MVFSLTVQGIVWRVHQSIKYPSYETRTIPSPPPVSHLLFSYPVFLLFLSSRNLVALSWAKKRKVHRLLSIALHQRGACGRGTSVEGRNHHRRNTNNNTKGQVRMWTDETCQREREREGMGGGVGWVGSTIKVGLFRVRVTSSIQVG